MSEYQGVPDRAVCPICGGEPVEENHSLSDIGYTDDEIMLFCENDHSWMVGVPIGEWGRDFFECESCESLALPHMLIFSEGIIQSYAGGRMDRLPFKLKVKCVSCYHTQDEDFELDENGVFLFGYPQVTGSIEDAQPKGWMEHDF